MGGGGAPIIPHTCFFRKSYLVKATGIVQILYYSCGSVRMFRAIEGEVHTVPKGVKGPGFGTQLEAFKKIGNIFVKSWQLLFLFF